MSSFNASFHHLLFACHPLTYSSHLFKLLKFFGHLLPPLYHLNTTSSTISASSHLLLPLVTIYFFFVAIQLLCHTFKASSSPVGVSLLLFNVFSLLTHLCYHLTPLSPFNVSLSPFSTSMSSFNACSHHLQLSRHPLTYLSHLL